MKQKPNEYYHLSYSGKIDEKIICEVAHKLKNGLGGISGFSSLLERGNQSEVLRRRYIKRIQEGVTKVNELVVDLMTLANAQISEPIFENVDLNSIVDRVWKGYNNKGKQKAPNINGRKFSVQEIGAVSADANMIQKMVFHAIRFLNIIGGKIENIRCISVSEKNVKVLFTFDVNESSDKMFDFMKGNMPVEGRLSLSIIQRIARMHSGRLHCKKLSDHRNVLSVFISRGIK